MLFLTCFLPRFSGNSGKLEHCQARFKSNRATNRIKSMSLTNPCLTWKHERFLLRAFRIEWTHPHFQSSLHRCLWHCFAWYIAQPTRKKFRIIIIKRKNILHQKSHSKAASIYLKREERCSQISEKGLKTGKREYVESIMLPPQKSLIKKAKNDFLQIKMLKKV